MDDVLLENYDVIEEDQEEYTRILDEVNQVLSENEVEYEREQNKSDYIIFLQ